MWHIMIHSKSYNHLVAVHIIAPVKLPPEDALEKATNVVEKLINEGKIPAYLRKSISFVRAGYEKLPNHQIEKEHYVVVYTNELSEKTTTCYNDVPQDLANLITQHRKQWLTLDYDSKNAEEIRKAYNVYLQYPQAKIYETRYGYHIKAKLPEPMDLTELLKLREKLHDDTRRIDFDKRYLEAGLGFLTNMLFNERYWFTEKLWSGEIEINPEQLKKKIPPRTVKISLRLPKVQIGDVIIDDDKVTVPGWWPDEKVKNLVQQIEDNFWEYQVHQIEIENVEEKFLEATRQISIKLYHSVKDALKNRDIVLRHEGDVLFVHVNRQELAGPLIGRQGTTVKRISEALQMKVKIVTQSMPETIEIRRRLKELLEKVI